MADAKKKEEDDDLEGGAEGRCQLSTNMIKLISLLTLLISDFDIVMTLVSMYTYFLAGGEFLFFCGVIGFFFLIYVAACVYAAMESGKFLTRFKDKVKMKEINGISAEDLDEALVGKRIFWMGPIFEKAKKQKGVIDTLKAITPAAVDPMEIDIELLEQALKDGQEVGADKTQMPDDPTFGAREMARAEFKLKTAKAAQKGEALPEDGDVNIVNEEAFNPELKQLELELADAESAGDENLAKMLTLVIINQLDHFKLPKKIMDKGKCTDEDRALYMVCEARGILQSYHKAARSFARRVIKASHSVPYYRLTYYGWQPQVGHFDFAGILNANAIYSFTVGLPQLLFSFAFIFYPRVHSPAPCELEAATVLCTLQEDLGRPNVQMNIVMGSIFVNICSIIISIANICIDFPAQIFTMMEKEEEELYHALQAEAATREWENKINEQLGENVSRMLKMSTQFKANNTPGMEAPQLVIDEVIKLEKAAMKRRVTVFEFFLVKQEKALAAARKARLMRKKKEAQEEKEKAAAKAAERV